MTSFEIGMAFVGILAFLILLRVPIGLALIGVSFVGLWTLLNFRVAWGTLGIVPYHFSSSWVLSSIPAFLFMGYLCSHTGLTQGLFNAARAWLGFLPGGLAIASVIGCAGFAAMSGSSVACSAAMGRIAVPEMVKRGYNPEMATSTVAAAGTLGALIPPSVLMIVYAVIAEVQVSSLFAGGALIGLISMLVYSIMIVARVKLKPALAPDFQEDVSFEEKLLALRDTWPMLIVISGTFGGLFAGVFTPTEAAAVGATLSCLVALLKGSLNWTKLFNAAVDAMKTTAAVMLIAMGASLFTRFLAISGSGPAIQSAVIGFGLDPVMLMVVVVCLYLLLGMFLEPMGAMLLTLPILLPILNEANIDLLLFGILLVKLLEVGCLTPPFGMNVFVMKSVVGKLVSTGAIFRGVSWFVVIDLGLIAAIVAFSGII